VVYVLDATDGSILKSFETLRPVPGAVTVVHYEADNPTYANLIKYAYATDTGGNVYRISAETSANSGIPQAIANSAPSTWIMKRIASLGCDEPVPADPDSCTGSNPSNRKFVFGPDVVNIPGTEDYVVLVGSGDREKPLTDYASAYNVPNYFYSIIDRPLTANWFNDDGIPESACMAASAGTSCCDDSGYACMDGLTTISKANIATGIDSLPDGKTLSPWGWKFQLDSHEQVVSGALTISDTVNFSTHIPEVYAPDACEGDLGDATTYNLDYLNADGRENQIIGGGLVPTPVAGKVIIPGYDDPIPFCIGCGGENSPIGGIEVTGAVTWTQPKNRVYWKIKK
jgi:type IV pilus assembly protein PilY1